MSLVPLMPKIQQHDSQTTGWSGSVLSSSGSRILRSIWVNIVWYQRYTMLTYINHCSNWFGVHNAQVSSFAQFIQVQCCYCGLSLNYHLVEGCYTLHKFQESVLICQNLLTLVLKVQLSLIESWGSSTAGSEESHAMRLCVKHKWLEVARSV